MSTTVVARGFVVSNVYNDRNRGGALLTHACVGALRRIAPASPITLFPTSTGQPPENFAFAMEHNERVSVAQGLPLRLGSQRFRNAAIAETLTIAARSSRSPVPRLLGGKDYSILSSAALVVGKGGQLFRDYASRSGLRSFALSSSPLMVASTETVPTALYGVQIGPYENSGAQKAASAVLKRIDAVLARDERSAQIAHDLGARNTVQIPDTVFGVDVTGLKDDSFRLPGRYDVLVVAESVLRLLGPEGVRLLIDTMTTRVRSGLADYTVVTAQSGANDGADFRAAAEVAERCSVVAPSKLLGEAQVGELLNVYDQASVVVTCRVHGGIMALLVHTPALVLCPSSTKAFDLFRSAGFEEVAVGPGQSAELIEVLRERLQAIGSDGLFSANEIGVRVTKLRDRVFDADKEIRSLLI